jgi:7-carboxy-7-deazaguanine synthase
VLSTLKTIKDMQESYLNYKFNLSEIFYSIQGEGTRAGMPCVFVRMQGCKLRCIWCDTKYALKDNDVELELTGEEIITKVNLYNCNFLQFTGGEPLQQKGIIPLMKYFCDNNYLVSIETNGHEDISDLDKRIVKIIDIKCPGSHMQQFNNYNNFNYLNPKDEIKFVIADRNDFDWAISITNKYSLLEKTNTILFSPVFGTMDSALLSKWILEDNLKVRLQLQIHKFIWSPETRGV